MPKRTASSAKDSELQAPKDSELQAPKDSILEDRMLEAPKDSILEAPKDSELQSLKDNIMLEAPEDSELQLLKDSMLEVPDDSASLQDSILEAPSDGALQDSVLEVPIAPKDSEFQSLKHSVIQLPESDTIQALQNDVMLQARREPLRLQTVQTADKRHLSLHEERARAIRRHMLLESRKDPRYLRRYLQLYKHPDNYDFRRPTTDPKVLAKAKQLDGESMQRSKVNR